MVAARDASRRSGRSREIISNSKSRGEHAATEIADGKKRNEYTSATSRGDGSRGGRGAQESYRKKCEWKGVAALGPEDCSTARTDPG